MIGELLIELGLDSGMRDQEGKTARDWPKRQELRLWSNFWIAHDLVERKWPGDIQRQQEQLDILKGLIHEP